MGKASRNQLCMTLFWIKATFALAIALGGLAGLSYKVYDKCDKAAAAAREAAAAAAASSKPAETIGDDLDQDTIGALVKSIEFVPGQCNNKGSYFVPPAGKAYLGYHLDWRVDNPIDITKRLGKRSPAIM